MCGRSSGSRSCGRARLRGIAIAGATALALAVPTAALGAESSLFAAGLTSPAGVVVDDARGRLWVSDRNAGFCRLTNPSFFALPSSAGVGALDAGTCFGGPLIGAPRGPIAPGQAVFIDPPDAPPKPGPPPPPFVDQVMLIPDASLGSSLVWRAMAQPNGTYFAQDAVTMITPSAGVASRPVAAAPGVGADAGSVYVVFAGSDTIQRIVNPVGPLASVSVEIVGRLSSPLATGVSVTGGFIGAGTVASPEVPGVYVAQSDGTVTSIPAPPTPLPAGFTPPVATPAYSAGGPIGAIASYTANAGRLIYVATAGARFTADAGTDRLDRFDTRTLAATRGYATGFTHAGGLTTGFAPANPVNGTVMVLDDPSAALLTPPLGAGRAFLVGLPVARVTGGPTGAPGGLPPAPGFTSSSTPAFTVTGFGMDGAAGAVTLQCRLFARGANPALTPWQDCTGGSYRQLAPLGEGGYVFAVQAVQGVAGIEQALAVTVDMTPPAAPVITLPADGSLIGGNPVFGFSASEPDLTFRCSLDGAPEAPCVAGPTFAFTADGAHALSVRAVDRAGNESVPSTPVAFTVDATPPTLSIDSPPEGAAVPGPDPVIRFSTGEAQAVFACRIDDGQFTPCRSPFTPTGLALGRHIVFVRATDVAGNVSPLLSRSFVLLAPSAAPPALGPGSHATPSRPRVLALRVAARDRLSRLRRKGLALVAVLSPDARFLRLRLVSAPATRAGAKSRPRVIATLDRRLKRGGSIRLTLPPVVLRGLGAGRYQVVAFAGLGPRVLGTAVAKTIRLTR